jgi:hypothetical protein
MANRTEFLVLTAIGIASVQPAHAESVASVIVPSQVCSLTSDIAPAGQGDAELAMIETIRPFVRDGRKLWRGVHHSSRILEEARAGTQTFDVADVDAATLRPVQGEARWPPAVVRFAYGDKDAQKLDADGKVLETIKLDDRTLLPMYPGRSILVMAMAWRDGLDVEGAAVDNYAGSGDSRLVGLRIRVTGRGTARYRGRDVPVFLTRFEASNGSLSEHSVTVERPHRIVTTAFTFRPGATPRLSRLVAEAIGPDC